MHILIIYRIYIQLYNETFSRARAYAKNQIKLQIEDRLICAVNIRLAFEYIIYVYLKTNKNIQNQNKCHWNGEWFFVVVGCDYISIPNSQLTESNLISDKYNKRSKIRHNTTSFVPLQYG